MEEIVGRDAELETIGLWLDAPTSTTLLVEGEPGIGKSTLWQAAVSEAEKRGFRTLTCVAAETEAALPFTVLRDLLDDGFDEAAEQLPPPQRRALAVVLFREEPDAAQPDAAAIAVAFLACLRVLSGARPTLVAVDDVQWVDDASRRPLAYALRRLSAPPPRAVLARRVGEGRLAELDGVAADVLEIGPLSIGALGHIVHERLGTAHPRPTLHRLHETSGGNPFYALELARALESSAAPIVPGAPLPVPGTLRELVRARLAELPPDTLDGLAYLAAMRRPDGDVLASLTSADPLQLLRPAFEAHVLEDGTELWFAHPLLRAGVLDLVTPARVREIHRSLAEALTDDEERARHLSLSVVEADEEIAAILEQTAEGSTARANRLVAAELYETAARLTPTGDAERRTRRALAAATALFDAGDANRAREILEELVATTRDAAKIDAQVLLGKILAEFGRWSQAMELWSLALAATDDPAVQADVRGSMATVTAQYTGPPTDAVVHADEGIAAAERTGDRTTLAYAYAARAMAAAAAGDAGYRAFLDTALELRGGALTHETAWHWSPNHAAAWCAIRAFEIPEMRVRFGEILEQGRNSGNADVEQFGAYGLAVGELAAGQHEQASELCAVVEELVEATGVMRLPTNRLRAELEAHVGRAEDARARLDIALAESEALGDKRYTWQVLAARGALELADGRPSRAAAELAAARAIASSFGMKDFATLTALVDEIEAAADAGLLEQADEALRAAGAIAEPPAWGAALLLRADAALLAQTQRLPEAEAALEQVVALGALSVWPLQHGRTLLALGVAQRRLRKRSRARESLEEARALFERIGAALWERAATSELGRIGGRASSPGALTPTEERVAELVAAGKSNKEVAAELVVTVHTVEAALTSIYRKLDVHSRTEMARKLAETAPSKH